jgi:hypothetical protein
VTAGYRIADILTQYPNTSEAQEAKKLLPRLKAAEARLKLREQIRDRSGSPIEVESRSSAARSVMANARTLCKIYEEAPTLVVECFADIPSESRLGFATAIANADAVLTGKARIIHFYLPGGQKFAQADELRGIRLTP